MHIKMPFQFNFSLRFQRKVRSTENRVIGIYMQNAQWYLNLQKDCKTHKKAHTLNTDFRLRKPFSGHYCLYFCIYRQKNVLTRIIP